MNTSSKRFSGTVFLLDEAKTTDREILFKVYGDDQLLYSTVITSGTMPQSFELDIQAVEFLEIKASNVISLSTMFTTFIGLDDAKLFV